MATYSETLLILVYPELYLYMYMLGDSHGPRYLYMYIFIYLFIFTNVANITAGWAFFPAPVVSVNARSDRRKYMRMYRSKLFSSLQNPIPLPAHLKNSLQAKQLRLWPIFLQEHCHNHCKKVN